MEDVRWIQRFSNFKKAFEQLQKAFLLSTQRELSDLEKSGVIQTFEYTFELAWKTLKNFLEHKGNFDILGSRDAIKLALQYNIIYGNEWLEMIKARNLTSHIYSEEEVEEILEAILHRYYPKLLELKEKLENEIRAE